MGTYPSTLNLSDLGFERTKPFAPTSFLLLVEEAVALAADGSVEVDVQRGVVVCRPSSRRRARVTKGGDGSLGLPFG